MINLLLLTLSLANNAPVRTAQFRPCVWPNTCKATAAPVVAQFTSCVWPNRCKSAPAPILESLPAAEVAQFTTCVWPRTCGKTS